MPDRDDGGQFTAKIDENDVLHALRTHTEPVATTSDLADTLGVTSETVRRHLQSLHDADRVGRKSVGARAVVWWATDADTNEDAPAAPLQDLVGLLDADAAAAEARERSQAWRDQFDSEVNADGD